MARIYETLPPIGRLQMALSVMTPTRLAQTFAAFDTLARQVGELYDLESAEHARLFRSQLDRRLCDRCHAPVVWEANPGEKGYAA